MATLRWNSESAVNTTLEGHQERGRVAALATGGYVVVWQDNSTPGTQHIRARVFDNAGQPILGELTLAAGTEAVFHSSPDVVGLSNGGFQVVWTRNASGGISRSIASAVFTSSGTLVRNIAVTAPLGERQDDTAAIARSGTGAAITWQRHGVAGPLLVTVDSAGTVSAEQSEASAAASFNATPGIAAAPDGSRIAVAWLLDTVGQVRVQLHGGTGTPYGTAAVVATNAGGYALFAPVVAWLAGGVFAVAWSSSQSAAPALGSEVMMRLYAPGLPNAEPVPLGPAFQVNGTSAGFQANVSLTATPGGGVVATWTDSGADGSGRSVRLQAFDGAGRRIGGEYRVNVEEDGVAPDIAALSDGRVVVTWQTIPASLDDPDANDMRMQIIDPRQGVVTGSAVSDVLFGNDLLADEIRGLDANDILRGLKGDDTLVGGNGTDTLQGGDGNDDLLGGAGDDLLQGERGNDDVQGGAGNDDLSGGPGLDVLRGGRGDDIYELDEEDTVEELFGEGTDTIRTLSRSVDLQFFRNFENVTLLSNLSLTAAGTSGPNVLDGSRNIAFDLLVGRGGDDTYVLGTGDRVIEVAGGGTDTIRTNAFSIVLSGFANVENVELLGAGALTATGTDGANVLSGEGSSAANMLIGLGGDDTYRLGAGDAVTETVGGGTDTVASTTISLDLANFANVENITLLGTLPLSASGNGNANMLDGEKNSAANALLGFGGNDIYVVGLGDTTVESGLGTDQVRSSTISLDLGKYAAVENLALLGALPLSGTGTAAANTLDGSANSAGNVLTGLGGSDFYVVGVGDTVVEAVGGGTDVVQSAVANISLLAFANVENAILTGAAPLSIIGSDAPNVMNGATNSAANILTGLGGNDTYQLGVGDAAIEAPGGGIDAVQTAVVDIDLASFPNVENIALSGGLALKATGSAADNVLNGSTNSAANQLVGLGGNDTYFVGSNDVVVEGPGGGFDTVLTTVSYTLPALAAVEELRNATGTTGLGLFGNGFVQTITGSAGNDSLFGGGGGDVLVGNGGTDNLTGGLGADRFRFLLPGDSAVGAGRDSVIGFVAAEGDRIDLSAMDANTLLAGDQGFIFRGAAAFTGARGEIRLVPAGADVIVQGTIAGTVPAFEIRVAGLASLVAGDFTL